MSRFIFDGSKPNIIMLSDSTDVMTMPKTLGPYKVAYTLRQHGYSVAVIHHLSGFSLEEITQLLRYLVNDQTIFVGFSNFFYANTSSVTAREDGGVSVAEILPGSMLPYSRDLNKFIKKLIKEKNPKCALVLGGPSAADFADNRDFDYVVTGYAEKSVINLANHLSRGEALVKSYRSIFGFTVLTDTKAEGYDFSQSHLQYEVYDGILPGETLPLEIGRGCIFKCTFCSYPLNGKKKNDYVRHRDLICKELLDNYQNFGITRYQMVDDTFNDTVEKCKMMAEISQSLPFKLEYWAYIRLDLLTAHPETIDYLFGNGLRGATFGIETFNDQTAKAIGKGGDRKRHIETLRRIKQQWGNSVGLHGNFVFGLPFETPDSLHSTINWLLTDDCPLDSWTTQTLNIRPNVSETYANNGFISQIDRDWKKLGYVEDNSLVDRDNDMYNATRHQYSLMWRNEYFDFVSLKKLTNNLQEKSNSSKHRAVGLQYAFHLASMMDGLDFCINQYNKDLDWYYIDQRKMQKICDYKNRIWKGLRVPNVPNFLQQINEYVTYSNYLINRPKTVIL